jgi:hypothetical protein
MSAINGTKVEALPHMPINNPYARANDPRLVAIAAST